METWLDFLERNKCLFGLCVGSNCVVWGNPSSYLRTTSKEEICENVAASFLDVTFIPLYEREREPLWYWCLHVQHFFKVALNDLLSSAEMCVSFVCKPRNERAHSL